MPRKKPTWMLHPTWTNEQYEMALWCANNNIIISPMGIHGSEKYKIAISLYDHRNLNKDKFEYDADQVWDKVSEYQKYYYVKNRGETSERD